MERRRWCVGVFGVSLGLIFSSAGIFALWAAPPRPGPVLPLLQVQARGPGGDDSPEAYEGLFFPEDRETLLLLRKAGEFRDQARYAEAVQALGGILAGADDYFFRPAQDGAVHRSIKSEAERLIGFLPPEARASYELQFGAEARRMLSQAASAGDARGVAEAARRFFHTTAGYEATRLVGLDHLDHGRPLAAALSFQRLLETPGAADRFEPTLSVMAASALMRAGMPEMAERTLTALKRKSPAAVVEIAGRDVPLFDRDEQALDWLASSVAPRPDAARAGVDQWTMFRGAPARNAASRGGMPLLAHRWRVPTANNDPAIEQAADQLRQAYLDQQIPNLPAFHVLAIDDVVLMRTVNNLLAVDFQTGKRLWEIPVDDPFGFSLSEGDAALGLAPGAGAAFRQFGGVSSDMVMELDRRLWDDAAFGAFSSDGDYVFTIEDLDFDAGQIGLRWIIQPNGRRVPQSLSPKNFNRLAAHDVRTGKLKWELGGPTGQYELEQAGTFFLGAPLPLAGRLYVLAETRGEIRLLALDAKTGGLEWSQQLAVLEQTIDADAFRRAAGVSPSYAAGVLVCPTVAGAVVAVDLTSRSLRWGYRYPRRDPDELAQTRLSLMRYSLYPGPGRGDYQRWIDATATIADGRVLLAPPDANVIECLNLADGELQWEMPREDGLYIACVEQRKVVIVGSGRVTARSLDDGEYAWDGKPLALPEGALPSGRGFSSDGRYYLPLSTAAIAAINLETGAVDQLTAARGALARQSERHSIPGNLICHGGAVLSQGMDFLERFDQLEVLRADVARTLAAAPDDPQALAQLGEIKLQEGAVDEAVEHLRRSLAGGDDPRTRELAIETMLTALKVNFARHKNLLPELDRLIDEPRPRGVMQRLAAQGLEEAGEVLAAFNAYLELVDDPADGEPAELEVINDALSVRRDRWVESHLASLYTAAADDERRVMDARADGLLNAAVASNDAAPLRRFVRYFGRHPLADEARSQLADRLITAETDLEAELLLRRLERSEDRTHAASATARLAVRLREAGRAEEAALYYRRLVDRWADVVCLDGLTGRQLVDALPDDEPARGLLAEAPAWPRAHVSVAAENRRRGDATRRYPLDMRGERGPFFSEMSVELEQNRQTLVGRDGMGRQRWRVSLADSNQQGRHHQFHPSWNHVRTFGHLLLVSMGNQLFAIDTLSASERSSARILWKRDLSESLSGVPLNRVMQARPVQAVPWAVPQMVATDAFGRPTGLTGAVEGDFVVFQQRNRLFAADLLTGETLWARNDLEPGCDIFGDEEMLFVTQPGVDEAVVLGSVDGRDLGRRAVPAPERRMGTFGRQVLTWSSEGNEMVLRMTDAATGAEVWTRHFEQHAKPWLIEHEAVGVLDRQGRFLLLKLPSGNEVINTQLEPEPHLAEIILLRSRDAYTLVANQSPANRKGVNVHPVPGGYSDKPINGRVYGFDRQSGAPLWDGPVRVEDQALLLDQPSELPVLTFACQIYEAVGDGRRRVTPRGSLLCLDKRTGKKVYDETLSSPITTFEVSADPDRRVVEVKTPVSFVEIAFSDQAPPADDAPPEDAPPQPDDPQPDDAQTGDVQTDDEADRPAASEETPDEAAAPQEDGDE